MGWAACRKLRSAIDNLRRILAIELVCGARALELRAPLTPAGPTGAVAEVVRAVTGPAGPDAWLSPMLEAVSDEIKAGVVVETAESRAGVLQ
jgi:histidine ammonia-lyase